MRKRLSQTQSVKRLSEREVEVLETEDVQASLASRRRVTCGARRVLYGLATAPALLLRTSVTIVADSALSYVVVATAGSVLTPSCRRSETSSKLSNSSTTLPPEMRVTTIPEMVTALPVGAIPARSPR